MDTEKLKLDYAEHYFMVQRWFWPIVCLMFIWFIIGFAAGYAVKNWGG